MTESPCPDDDDLLPLATGEQVPDAVSSHVAACHVCQRRLRGLRGEISSLRWALKGAEADTTVAQSPNGSGQTPAAGVAAPAAGNSPAEPFPAMIGRYRVIGTLAIGGQAHVYRVVHPTLAKDLVLKLSRRPLDSLDPGRDHLVAEGKLLAELDHPNIARVVDLDFHADRPFLVMELVRGRNLRQHFGQHRPPPREAAALAAQIARALAPAHAAGVIHHDIKPDNIVIDEAGRPRIIDFGMALLRHAWADDTGDPDTISGSVPYMAPEQARGEKERLDTHSDIFSLGAVLYEMLTGAAPFLGTDLPDSLARARRCEFDRDALRAPGIPQGLAAVCLKAMSPEPEGRHANVESLAGELDRFAKPRSARLVVLSVLAALLLSSAAAYAMLRPTTPVAGNFQELIQVQRQGRPFSIEEAAPLSHLDRFQVRCEIPAGWKASLFWFGSDGRLTPISADEVRQSPAGGSELVVYPGHKMQTLDAIEGTEFVLICAAPRDPPAEKDVVGVFEELKLLEPWPKLPHSTLVVMNHQRVDLRAARPEEVPRGLSKQEHSAAAAVQLHLDQLRQRLGGQSPFLAGLAFPHAEP